MASVSRGRRLMGDINVVPYIDVMLVLLIIFMITARNHSIRKCSKTQYPWCCRWTGPGRCI
jgi:biopolymer transport protein ExbD